MSADPRARTAALADLTSPGGPNRAFGERSESEPYADVLNDGNQVLAVEDVFAGNGYTAASTDSNDSETTADLTSDLESDAALHARSSLGGRASVSETAAPAPTSVAVVDFAELDVPGADPDDDLEAFVAESTPAQVAEAKEFFARAKAAESPDQVKRARMQSRVFSVMQYREHPETGEVMLTQEQIDEGLATLGDRLHRWAYVWHPYDRLVEVDEGTGEAVCCGLKGLHAHMVLWIADAEGARPTIRTVSDAFSIPSARVKPPKETVEQEGTEHKGRGAAEKAFFDLSEYLPHESRGKDAIRGIHHPDRHYLVDKTQEGKPGKYQYGRGRIVANFDFGPELDTHMAMRRNAADGGGSAKLSKLFQAVGKGSLTLTQVRDQEPAIYFAKGNLAHFQKLRGDFLAHQDAPESVLNFYVFGEGGTGKDLLAKALARALAPDADKPYFKVGGENVSWEGYDGETVVIWEDMRVGDMIRTAKNRGMLFRILGPWREPDEKPIVNIKGSKTQLLNRVNIVTGPEGYEEFLRGLAGEYESMQGGVRVKHQAENLGQGFRRFPVIIPVAEREFSIFVNSGVLNGTREYQSYERYEHMRQDLELLARKCKAIKDTAERERVRGAIEARTVAPIVEHYDRIARPELEPIDGDELFAEFAGVGQPIPQSVVEVPSEPIELSPRDRCICIEWQGYALDHTVSCPIRTDAESAMAEMRQREAERDAAAEARRQAELERKVARIRANGGLLAVGGVR
ncbi:RNA helicase [Kocuria atrinae]|uniref:Helicase superfamily 3 single-stranded DNA/RNA virus domain-containing protein n=1 Tax=Kocuria atrinae TaxID=592377 RepID=A0ABP5JA42_9MICC